jgi:hypothetical protein
MALNEKIKKTGFRILSTAPLSYPQITTSYPQKIDLRNRGPVCGARLRTAQLSIAKQLDGQLARTFPLLIH